MNTMEQVAILARWKFRLKVTPSVDMCLWCRICTVLYQSELFRSGRQWLIDDFQAEKEHVVDGIVSTPPLRARNRQLLSGKRGITAVFSKVLHPFFNQFSLWVINFINHRISFLMDAFLYWEVPHRFPPAPSRLHRQRPRHRHH